MRLMTHATGLNGSVDMLMYALCFLFRIEQLFTFNQLSKPSAPECPNRSFGPLSWIKDVTPVHITVVALEFALKRDFLIWCGLFRKILWPTSILKVVGI
jgi:hypothetical protein